jgi:flavodoxin
MNPDVSRTGLLGRGGRAAALPSRRSFLAMAALAVTGASATGCSLLEEERVRRATDGPTEVAEPIEGSRTLVAFLSVPETDEPEGMTDEEENSTHVVNGRVYGNVQYLAQLIAARTGAEVFRIDTAEPLPLEHGPLIDLALEWQEQGVRPRLAAQVPDLRDYDTIFIGYPIWWYDLPQPMYSFLEQHDFAGKTVVLFSVHGGSQLSGTDVTIAEMLTDSTVVSNALTISRDDMDGSEDEVSSWLDDLAVA